MTSYAWALKFNGCHDKDGQFCETGSSAETGATDFSKVSQDEGTATHNYTRNSVSVNGGLRALGSHAQGDAVFTTPVAQHQGHTIKHLDQVIASHPLPEATTLYRVTRENVVAKLKEGEVIQDFGYTSTSKTLGSMDQISQDVGFVKGKKKLKTAVITIRAPKGMGHVDVNGVMQRVPNSAPHRYFHQHEVILPRGTKYKVISKKKNAAGMLELVLEAQL